MRKRSRNFDGCWTCRLRKIKCDATKPICLRCQKAKLECKGYGIVLAWADSITLGENNELVTIPMSRTNTEEKKESGWLRRNVELVKFPKSMQFESYAKLNHVVVQLDDVSKNLKSEAYFSGPFGVYRTRKIFKKNAPVVESMSLASSDSRNLMEDGMVDSSTRKREKDSSFTERFGSIFSNTDNEFVHYELLDAAKLTIVAIKGSAYKFSEQSMFHILYPKFFANVDSDDWLPNIQIFQNFFTRKNKQIIIFSKLGETMLFLSSEHFNFIHIKTVNSGWDVLVVPLLKQIFFELVCEEYSILGNWDTYLIDRSETDVPREKLLKNLRFGVLCMSLASCTFHKFLNSNKKSPRNADDEFHVDEDLKLSIELRKFGCTVLDYHLDEYDNNSLYPQNDFYNVYLLLALILQIHLDNSFGVFENYELNFAIGDFILKEKSRWKPPSRMSHTERYLRHFLNILNIFYESTQAINFFNYSILEADRMVKYLDLNENYDLSKRTASYADEFDSSESEEHELDDRNSSHVIRVDSLESESHQPSFTIHFNKRNQQDLLTSAESKAIRDQDYQIPKHSLLESSSSTHPITPNIEDSSVYLTFGLPKSLIELFHEVIQLTNHKNVFRTKGVTPRNFPRICAETEDRLINWNVENYWKLYDNEYNPISNVATKTFISKFHEGLFYNVTSFHSALLVYYKRLIPGSPIESYQENIKTCFDALEKLIAMSANSVQDISLTSFSPSFWPLLVCGCDIDLTTNKLLKQKCQDLWKAKCFTRYNYWRSKQILFEVWKRREEDKENNGFMDMIREWGIVLCLG